MKKVFYKINNWEKLWEKKYKIKNCKKIMRKNYEKIQKWNKEFVRVLIEPFRSVPYCP